MEYLPFGLVQGEKALPLIPLAIILILRQLSLVVAGISMTTPS